MCSTFEERSRIIRFVCYSSIAMVLVVAPALLAGQGTYSLADNDRGVAQSTAVIQLEVRDSSIRSILWMISKQSGRQIVFDNSLPALDRAVSIQLEGSTVLKAVDKVLRGSGLRAERVMDGGAIVVSPSKDRTDITEQAQNGRILGRVIDSITGKGLSGVVVQLQGVGRAAVSDSKGSFVFGNVPVGKYSLSAKLLGYQTKSLMMVISGNGAVNITMALRQAGTTLSEVVTTAVGSQRRVEIGNDIARIDASEILDRAPVRNVADILRYAQVPGVQVVSASGDPGAPAIVRMRGIGSISQSTDPAIIVDGIWISSNISDSSVINQAGGGGLGTSVRYTSSPLDQLDPTTIESIEIVKGPSAASLYGQEAANGVIVITTKKGTSGVTTWSYRAYTDWDSQVRPKHGAWVSYGTTQLGFLGSCDIRNHYDLICVQDSVANMNSFHGLLDNTGPSRSFGNTMSVRGGSSSILYSVSGRYDKNIGTRRTVPVDLIKLRLLKIPHNDEIIRPARNSIQNITSSMSFMPGRSLSFDLASTISKNSIVNTGVKTSEYNIDGSSGLADLDTLRVLNTRSQVDIDRGGSDKFTVLSSLIGRYNFEALWNFEGQLGFEKSQRLDFNRKEMRSCYQGLCSPQNTRNGLKRASIETEIFTGRGRVAGSIHTPMDKLVTIVPSVGFDVKRSLLGSVSLGLNNASFGSEEGSGEGTGYLRSSDMITAGYYVNASLKILNRMYFDIGFRQDAGSVIKTNSSGSRFPKLATSWLVSDEGFFPKSRFLGQFRVRGAIGYAAVHPEAADLYGKYTYSTAIINGVEVVTGELNTVGNNKLVPERSMEIEGGLDADFLNDRVQLGLTLAHKALKNAIITRNLPVSSGLNAGLRKENISRVDNRSVEITVDARIIDNDAVFLNLRSGISNTNNVIKRLGNNALVVGNTVKDRLVEGYQIGSVWEFPVLGYGDVDGNGYIDDTEVLLGDTTIYKGWNTPKFRASYNTTLSVLNRSLTLAMDFSHVGPRVIKATYNDNYGSVVLGAPIPLQALALSGMKTGGTSVKVSEIRLMNASLSYNLPRRFTDHLDVKSLVVAIRGSNIALWTDYSGRDPMINSTPIGNSISDDGWTIPMPRKYSMELRVTL